MAARDTRASDDPGRTPRLTFAETPADPADYLPPTPPGRSARKARPRPAASRRFMLRLTPNDAPPLATSLASLDRALIVFTIGDATTPEHIAEHIITALDLNGRVHVVLEPLPADDEPPRGGAGPRGNSNPSGLNTYSGRALPSGEQLAPDHWWWLV